MLAEVGLADPTGAGCLECVYWGKEDNIMLDVVRELPEAKVGYTIANFSAALREAGVDQARTDVHSHTQTDTRARAHTRLLLALNHGFNAEIETCYQRLVLNA